MVIVWNIEIGKWKHGLIYSNINTYITATYLIALTTAPSQTNQKRPSVIHLGYLMSCWSCAPEPDNATPHSWNSLLSFPWKNTIWQFPHTTKSETPAFDWFIAFNETNEILTNVLSEMFRFWAVMSVIWTWRGPGSSWESLTCAWVGLSEGELLIKHHTHQR